MTDNFYARYRLLKCVFMDDNIRSHNAQEVESGRVVMVHLTSATADADVATFRAELDRLTGANQRCIVETAMLPSGFAIVTEFLPNTLSFRAWMDSQLNGGTPTSPGIPSISPLVGAPVEPSPFATLSPIPSPVSGQQTAPPTAASPLGAPQAPAASKPPGEFTMMFAPGRTGDFDAPPSPNALPMAANIPAPPPAAPAISQSAPPAAKESGLFTQMFSPGADAPPPAAAPVFPPAAPSPAPRTTGASQPGEFTLQFGTRDSAAPQPASPPPSPLRPVVERPVVEFTPFATPGAASPYPGMPQSGMSSSGPPPAAMPPAGGSPLNAFAPSHQSDASPLLGGGRVTPLHAAPTASPLDRQPPAQFGHGAPLSHELPPPLPPLNAPAMGGQGVQQSSLASPLASPQASAQSPHSQVPSVLPPPSFPGGGSTTPLSMQGGAVPHVRAQAGPSEFTQIITGGAAPAVPKPAAPAAVAHPVPVKRSIPTGLIVAINIVLLLAILLVALVLKKPRATVPNPKLPPAPTVPAIVKPRE